MRSEYELSEREDREVMARIRAMPLSEVVEQVPTESLLSSPEVCQQAGCTYRQLDFWVRCGYIRPARAAAGYGTQRGFDLAEVVVLRRMVTLVKAGLAPQVAAHAARNGYTTWLSDTVRVSISPLVVRILPGWEGNDAP